MELTGKCKEDFEKWYFKNHCNSNIKYEEMMPHDESEIFGWYYNIHDSFKYGVYVDFFDSVGIYFDIEADKNKDDKIAFFVMQSIWKDSFKEFKTRDKARIYLIKKANEIYNNK